MALKQCSMLLVAMPCYEKAIVLFCSVLAPCALACNAWAAAHCLSQTLRSLCETLSETIRTATVNKSNHIKSISSEGSPNETQRLATIDHTGRDGEMLDLPLPTICSHSH